MSADEMNRYLMVFDATEEQKDDLIRVMGEVPIHGTVWLMADEPEDESGGEGR